MDAWPCPLVDAESGAESIADAADCFDEVGIVVQLLPKCPDVNVDRAVQCVRVFAVAQVH